MDIAQFTLQRKRIGGSAYERRIVVPAEGSAVMAYIPSHQTLRNHRKTGRLMRVLGVSRPTAIGHLHCLWWWCLDNAPDGDLSAIDSEDIADGALWEGDPNVFVNGLMFAGFVDESHFVHDWGEYTGRLLVSREKDKERVREWRENKAAGGSVEEESEGVTRNVTGNEAEYETGSEPASYAVRLNNTKLNKTKSDTSAIASVSETHIARFALWWNSYPRKTAKQAAERAWMKLAPGEALVAEMHSALEKQKQSDQWQRDSGAYIPYPATWLNGRRWEDELPISSGLVNTNGSGPRLTTGNAKAASTVANVNRFIERHKGGH